MGGAFGLKGVGQLWESKLFFIGRYAQKTLVFRGVPFPVLAWPHVSVHLKVCALCEFCVEWRTTNTNWHIIVSVWIISAHKLRLKLNAIAVNFFVCRNSVKLFFVISHLLIFFV